MGRLKGSGVDKFEVVKAYNKEQINFSRIADQFGITRERVRQICEEAGVVSNSLRKAGSILESIDKIKEWAFDGLGKREVAKKLGVSEGALMNAINTSTETVIFQTKGEAAQDVGTWKASPLRFPSQARVAYLNTCLDCNTVIWRQKSHIKTSNQTCQICNIKRAAQIRSEKHFKALK